MRSLRLVAVSAASSEGRFNVPEMLSNRTTGSPAKAMDVVRFRASSSHLGEGVRAGSRPVAIVMAQSASNPLPLDLSAQSRRRIYRLSTPVSQSNKLAWHAIILMTEERTAPDLFVLQVENTAARKP